MYRQSKAFVLCAQAPRESVGAGLTRQLFGCDDSLLMARVEFEAGAFGDIHSHIYSQVRYVKSGEFDAHMDGVEKSPGPGDRFYIQPNLDHGATCRKAGALLDVFSPVREDFLNEDEK